MKRIISIKLLFIIICSCIYISCYSRIDLDNFVEFEKTGIVSLPNNDITIIYVKGTTKTDVEGNDPNDKKYLILKTFSEEIEKIIFQGHRGHVFDKMFVDKENQRLIFTLRDLRVDSYYYQLIFYDLEEMKIINKISVNDTIKKNKSDDFIYTRTAITAGIIVDEVNRKFIFQIHYSAGHGETLIHNNYQDYIIFDINTGSAEEIVLDKNENISNYFQISSRDYIFNFQDKTKELFFIFSESKVGLKYFKSKYHGTYINDGTNNIRISKYHTPGYKTFWLENGQYVISGSYLYDTSGKLHELKLIDGSVLAVY